MADLIVKLDKATLRRLREGKEVLIRLPKDATMLSLRLRTADTERNWVAECMDVFFNGRKAS